MVPNAPGPARDNRAMTSAQGAADRDRDADGRARNARPRDGLGRPLPYGADGVERQPEGVVRTPEETVAEAQALLDAGRPFHAHEVFEDAWKSGPEEERGLWRGLAQLAVGLTHAARGNTKGGARLLLRGAGAVSAWTGETGRERPYGIGVPELARWARALAERVEGDGAPLGVTGAAEAAPALVPRAAAQAHRSAGEAPRSAAQAPRPAGEAPRPAEEAPRSAAGEAPRSAEEAPRSAAGGAPRSAEDAPHPSDTASRTAEDAPHPSDTASRTAEQDPRPRPEGPAGG
ncbi:hypothetical protein GCM10018785_17600 [Streptomyces longispororuber]|uniref:DUF309 domain-containing protein n=1 Tax=Streptomyces longispororuber TaxID=68230 RepID=A0A918ZFA9_9ACTN|nr:hypothetical protein GCM10018785_17600 [Streptomyces longispororuber]